MEAVSLFLPGINVTNIRNALIRKKLVRFVHALRSLFIYKMMQLLQKRVYEKSKTRALRVVCVENSGLW